MGSCVSSNIGEESKIVNKVIRVVHFNGYLENFEDPITVGQVTSKSPKYFLCTPTQLILHDLKPLKPDTQLTFGRIYFLLPYSAFRFEVSSVDLASLSKKLTTVAKTGRGLSTTPYSSQQSCSTHAQKSPSTSSYGSSLKKISPADESPNWFTSPCEEIAVDLRMSTKLSSWKPMLATIRERSIRRRSETDFQEHM